MPQRAKKPTDAELNRDIQRFSNRALVLAKAVVDGVSSDADKKAAAALAVQLPQLAAQSRDFAEAYRATAAKALADARLDLAYVAAGGGIPSSLRLGWYIKEKSE
ncbi:MAG: hypothetical protein ABI782_05835, partial [Anaerolineaceae bacterium]